MAPQRPVGRRGIGAKGSVMGAIAGPGGSAPEELKVRPVGEHPHVKPKAEPGLGLGMGRMINGAPPSVADAVGTGPAQSGESGPAEDFASETERLRAGYLDQVWRTAAAFAAIVLVSVPLRDLALHRWQWATTMTVCIAAVMVAIFPFNRRLRTEIRAAAPVLILMVGAVTTTLASGIQDVGPMLLLMANIAVAMLFERRIAIVSFAVTAVVLFCAGVGFVSHRLPLYFSTDYPVSWAGWLIAVLTTLGLGVPVLGGVISYRHALEALSRRIAVQRDEIAAQRDRIEVLATHDTLTGLPNRQLAEDRLLMATRMAARAGESLAVLYIDLDGFKGVNDRLGHEAGDEVLRSVADRLNRSIRAADTAARLGGDEFLVILGRSIESRAARDVARNLAEQIRQPIPWARQMIRLTASIGVAMFPRDGETPDDLLSFADTEMYAAKRAAGAGR